MDSEVEAVAQAIAAAYWNPSNIDECDGEKTWIDSARAAIDALDKARRVEGDVEEIARGIVNNWLLKQPREHDLVQTLAAALLAERQAGDRRVEELDTKGRALIDRVEGVFGYGTLQPETPDGLGPRLKDTREWVEFYNAIRSRGDKS